MFSENLLPFTKSLLASKFRHHSYYLNKFGETNLLVQSFEVICAEKGVGRSTIIAWGKLIDDAVNAGNAANLALATGQTADAAAELSHLKGHVATLTTKLAAGEKDMKEMKALIATQNSVLERQTDLLASIQQSLQSRSTVPTHGKFHCAFGVVLTQLPYTDDQGISETAAATTPADSAALATITPSASRRRAGGEELTPARPNPLLSMMRTASNGYQARMIPVSNGFEPLKTKTTEYLVQLVMCGIIGRASTNLDAVFAALFKWKKSETKTRVKKSFERLKARCMG